MALVDPLTISVNCSGPGSTSLPSKTKFNIAQLTGGNFATQVSAAASLDTAYESLTFGIRSETLVSHRLAGSNTIPAVTANRGQKWILTAEGTNGRLYTYTIPGAPGDGELQPDNISADLTGTVWAAFKSAFEALCVDPFGGSLVLNSAKLGGRRR